MKLPVAPKLPSRSAMEKRLDELCSLIVRKRGRCQKPGCQCDSMVFQCCHIFTRKRRSTRWDFDNLMCMHPGCHKFWWHVEVVEAAAFAKKLLGEEKFYALERKSNTTKKWTITELLELEVQLRDRLREANTAVNDLTKYSEAYLKLQEWVK